MGWGGRVKSKPEMDCFREGGQGIIKKGTGVFVLPHTTRWLEFGGSPHERRVREIRAT